MKNHCNTQPQSVISSLLRSVACPAFAAALLATGALTSPLASASGDEPYVSEMRAFAFGWCPRGWAPANGGQLSINQNQAMFALMGTTHGGNGMTTFDLPDLQARTPLHEGTLQGWGGGAYTRGQKGGQEQVTLTTAQMPAHQHQQVAANTPAQQARPTSGAVLAQAQNAGLYVDAAATNTNLNSAPVGGNQPVSTRDPYLAITWCVATLGIFPSSN